MIIKIGILILLIFLYLYIIIYKKFLCNFFICQRFKSYNSPKKHCIAIVIGSAPEAIKMIPIIKLLKKNKKFLWITINVGPHKMMIKQILNSFNMSIDINLNIFRNNDSPAESSSKIIFELNKIYSLINPDALIVQGDTISNFAAAFSAFYQKIPIFHIDAGLRTNNVYLHYPDLFNGVIIDDLSTLYFVSTESAANNLVKENKNPNNIFITGNIVVDALKYTLENTTPSKYIQSLQDKSKSRCESIKNCRIILITYHETESYYEPIANILNSIKKLLENFDDIVIIFSFHLNQNVLQSIKTELPENIFNKVINGKSITEHNYLFFNRLLLIKPLDNIDLIHLQNSSFFIITDSYDILKESISLGKPVLILRESTERPEEEMLKGSTFLTGISANKIYSYALLLLKNRILYAQMARPYNSYIPANSSSIIVNIIEGFFQKKILNTYYNFSKLFNKETIFQYDNSFSNYDNDYHFDLVIVLTVWKRNNLNEQLKQIKRQSILKNKKTNIIVFQNYYHINVDKIIEKWKKPGRFSEQVMITFIKSPLETGYFGRFISPLISPVTNNAYFIVCDDDVIWGDRYFENMIRVVNEGFLATRNGRLINKEYKEILPNHKIFIKKNQVCFNEDIEYDFGGHIWAGRISWLRKAWKHIPISLENLEDLWLCATLKTYYNISTKTPKCPCPEDHPINPELCAASHKSAQFHINSQIGKKKTQNGIREKLIKEIIIHLKFKPMLFSDSKALDKINNQFIFGNRTHPLFDLSDSLWKNALFWQ